MSGSDIPDATEGSDVLLTPEETTRRIITAFDKLKPNEIRHILGLECDPKTGKFISWRHYKFVTPITIEDLSRAQWQQCEVPQYFLARERKVAFKTSIKILENDTPEDLIIIFILGKSEIDPDDDEEIVWRLVAEADL